MSLVLLLVVIIAGLAFYFDQKKRAEIRGKTVVQKQVELTEDEAPITATGRMKIAPVMKKLKEQAAQKAQQAAKSQEDDEEKEDEALPDPFASGTRRRPK